MTDLAILTDEEFEALGLGLPVRPGIIVTQVYFGRDNYAYTVRKVKDDNKNFYVILDKKYIGRK